MREKQIEQKLVKEIKKLNGLCLKLTCPGFAGMPDRPVSYTHLDVYKRQVSIPKKF